MVPANRQGVCSEQTVESIRQSPLVPAIRLGTPYKIQTLFLDPGSFSSCLGGYKVWGLGTGWVLVATRVHAKGKAGPCRMQLHSPCPHDLFGKKCCVSLPVCLPHLLPAEAWFPRQQASSLCEWTSQLLTALLEISLAVTDRPDRRASSGSPMRHSRCHRRGAKAGKGY